MDMRLAALLFVAMAVLTLPTAAGEDVAWGAVCLDEGCDGAMPLRVVEYFGADWCEPCRPVETMLENLTVEGVLVVHHRPSPADAAFSNASHLRFSTHYGLLGLPAIVIDGHALLSGETMALRIQEALEAIPWTPPTDATANLSLASWTSGATVRPNVHLLHANVTPSVAGATSGGVHVVLYDPPSNGSLVAALEATTEDLRRPPLSPFALLGVTVGLGLLLAPAVVLHLRSMRPKQAPAQDEEG